MSEIDRPGSQSQPTHRTRTTAHPRPATGTGRRARRPPEAPAAPAPTRTPAQPSSRPARDLTAHPPAHAAPSRRSPAARRRTAAVPPFSAAAQPRPRRGEPVPAIPAHARRSGRCRRSADLATRSRPPPATGVPAADPWRANRVRSSPSTRPAATRPSRRAARRAGHRRPATGPSGCRPRSRWWSEARPPSLLALCSGVTGAVVATAVNDNGGISLPVSTDAAPVVNRDSLAGVARKPSRAW